jgi:hypothetical protein
VAAQLPLRPQGEAALSGDLETAHRARGNCGQVFRYAIATRRAERDPSADLRPLGRAYNRTAHLAERRRMMTVWADYLDKLKADVKVLQFKQAEAI